MWGPRILSQLEEEGRALGGVIEPWYSALDPLSLTLSPAPRRLSVRRENMPRRWAPTLFGGT